MSASATGPFLVFDLGPGEGDPAGGTFALDVSHVYQVIEPGSVSPVPLAPAIVQGILNHHGRIVTVVDAAPLLELPPQGGAVAQAVVLRQGLRGPASLAMKVTRIHGIVARGDLATVDAEARPCVAWVAQAGSQMVHVVALEPLLERLSRLFGSVESRPAVEGATV